MEQTIAINLSLILQFIDRARFIASSLSKLVNNFPEGTHKIKCKYGRDDKKFEICGITREVCNCFLEHINFKDNLIAYSFSLYHKLSTKV